MKIFEHRNVELYGKLFVMLLYSVEQETVGQYEAQVYDVTDLILVSRKRYLYYNIVLSILNIEVSIIILML